MLTVTARRLGVAGATLAIMLPLAACGTGAAPGSSASAPGAPAATDKATEFTVLSANENPTFRKMLDALSTGACKAENDALPLKHETVAQADVVQKVTLLAGQGALPVHFIAGTAQVRPSGDLGKAKLTLDYKEALTALGVWENVSPAAASTIQSVYGGMVSLPYQYNIEGIWYNKKLFADNGVTEPKTYAELVAAMDKLKAAGVVPMAQSGAAMWPLTRLVGLHIFRDVGPAALADVRDGKAKLTDAKYVAGAQALADMGKKGYFGDGFASRDIDSSTNLFLSGKAGMIYNGSWMLSNINNPQQNTIGAENIGFMAFPAVTGGAGSADQWPANAGTAHAMSKDLYGPKVGNWLKCISANYGAQALQDAGVISGFKVNKEVTGLPATTRMVQEKVSAASSSVLWFEALMDSKSSAMAGSNVTLLATGQLSPADYMAKLQQSIDANK